MAWPVSTRTTGTLITAAIYNSDLVDNLNAIINASGNLAVAGTGPHAIGGAVSATAGLGIYGTVAPLSGIGSGVVIGQTIHAVVNQGAYGFYLSPTLVEAGSGTHNLFAGMYLTSPTITAGAAAVTNAATFYIAGAPATGVNSLAIWVASGSTRLDGALYVSFQGPHGIGVLPAAQAQLVLGGSYGPTGASYGSALEITSTMIPEANDDCMGLLVAPTLTEASSGTHGSFTGAQFNAPVITANTATLTNATTVVINGVPAATATFTAALLIETGGDDGNHVIFSSSDIAHGITTVAPSTAYGTLRKGSATDGGLEIAGFTETNVGIVLRPGVTTADTTKSSAANAAVIINSGLKTGTTLTSMSANSNLFAIRNEGAARFIFDADGDSHQDIGTAWTNFDAYDDVALLNGLSAALARDGDPLRTQFAGWLGEHRQTLQDLKLVTFNDDGHHFANWSRFHMVEVGAIRQLGRTLDAITQRLAQLEAVSRG